MVKKSFRLTLTLDLHKVTCPGVWLCPKGRVFITVSLFRCTEATRQVKPNFPLKFRQRFVFDKVFDGVESLSDFETRLCQKEFRLEMVQIFKSTLRIVSLAMFQAPLTNVLYPIGSKSGQVEVDMLFERCKSFPGIIAPKAEVTLKVNLEELEGKCGLPDGTPPTLMSSCPNKDLSTGIVHSESCKAPLRVCHTRNTACPFPPLIGSKLLTNAFGSRKKKDSPERRNAFGLPLTKGVCETYRIDANDKDAETTPCKTTQTVAQPCFEGIERPSPSPDLPCKGPNTIADIIAHYEAATRSSPSPRGLCKDSPVATSTPTNESKSPCVPPQTNECSCGCRETCKSTSRPERRTCYKNNTAESEMQKPQREKQCPGSWNLIGQRCIPPRSRVESPYRQRPNAGPCSPIGHCQRPSCGNPCGNVGHAEAEETPRTSRGDKPRPRILDMDSLRRSAIEEEPTNNSDSTRRSARLSRGQNNNGRSSGIQREDDYNNQRCVEGSDEERDNMGQEASGPKSKSNFHRQDTPHPIKTRQDSTRQRATSGLAPIGSRDGSQLRRNGPGRCPIDRNSPTRNTVPKPPRKKADVGSSESQEPTTPGRRNSLGSKRNCETNNTQNYCVCKGKCVSSRQKNNQRNWNEAEDLPSETSPTRTSPCSSSQEIVINDVSGSSGSSLMDLSKKHEREKQTVLFSPEMKNNTKRNKPWKVYGVEADYCKAERNASVKVTDIPENEKWRLNCKCSCQEDTSSPVKSSNDGDRRDERSPESNTSRVDKSRRVEFEDDLKKFMAKTEKASRHHRNCERKYNELIDKLARVQKGCITCFYSSVPFFHQKT